MRDDGYAMYLRDGLPFLSGILSVSQEAGHILSRVLDPNPRTRITIPELRRAVLSVTTFFPSDDLSIQEVPRDEILTDATFEVPVEGSTKTSPSPSPVPQLSAGSSDDSDSDFSVEIAAVHSTFVNEVFPHCSSDSEPEHESDSGSESGSDSELGCAALKAPANRSTDFIAIIPYLALAELEALALQIPKPVKAHSRLASPVRRFVGAIHRIF